MSVRKNIENNIIKEALSINNHSMWNNFGRVLDKSFPFWCKVEIRVREEGEINRVELIIIFPIHAERSCLTTLLTSGHTDFRIKDFDEYLDKAEKAFIKILNKIKGS